MVKKKFILIIILVLLFSIVSQYKTYATENGCQVSLISDGDLVINGSKGTREISIVLNPNGHKIKGIQMKIHTTSNVKITNIKINSSMIGITQASNEDDKSFALVTPNDDKVIDTEINLCTITVEISDTSDIDYASVFTDFNDGFSGFFDENDQPINNSSSQNLLFNFYGKQDAVIEETIVEAESDIEQPEQPNPDPGSQDDFEEIPSADEPKNPTQQKAPTVLAKTGEQHLLILVIAMVAVSVFIFIKKKRIYKK